MAQPSRLALFDIAVATGGGWDVDEMAGRMPLGLLYEWLGYFNLRPTARHEYRQRRGDWNAAMGATTVGNLVLGLWSPRSRPRPRRIEDLMFPEKRLGDREETAAEMYQKLKAGLRFYGNGSKKKT